MEICAPVVFYIYTAKYDVIDIQWEQWFVYGSGVGRAW